MSSVRTFLNAFVGSSYFRLSHRLVNEHQLKWRRCHVRLFTKLNFSSELRVLFAFVTSEKTQIERKSKRSLCKPFRDCRGLTQDFSFESILDKMEARKLFLVVHSWSLLEDFLRVSTNSLCKNSSLGERFRLQWNQEWKFNHKTESNFLNDTWMHVNDSSRVLVFVSFDYFYSCRLLPRKYFDATSNTEEKFSAELVDFLCTVTNLCNTQTSTTTRSVLDAFVSSALELHNLQLKHSRPWSWNSIQCQRVRAYEKQWACQYDG